MKQINLSGPSILLHLEGAVVLALAILFYSQRGGNWLLFLLLLFVPDISALGYLAGTRIGAYCYNAIHTTLLPAILIAFGLITANTLEVSIALIWFSHIGLDRMLGFGLKYPTEFKDTHFNHL